MRTTITKKSTLKLADYMNPERFPETSQKGCSPAQQLLSDSHRIDLVNEAESRGQRIAPEAAAFVKELKEKEPWIGPLTKEAAELEAAKAKPGAPTPSAS